MKTIAVPVEPMWGISDEADFDEYTWTFKMSGDYRVAAGAYAIIPEKEYKALVAALAAAPPQSEPAYEFIGQVAHDIANDGKCGPVVWWQSFRDFPDGTNIYAVRPTATPQSEPADHLADPDSRERARNALRAITNAGSIGHAKRIAMQALGDTNAAPEQSERESITSPSQEGCAVGTAPTAAPVWSNCALSRCQASMRCGWPDKCQSEQNAAGQDCRVGEGACSLSQSVPEPVPAASCLHRRVSWTADMKHGTCWDCGKKLGDAVAPAAPTTMNLGERAESTLPLSAEEICLAWDKPMTSAEAAKWHMTGGFVAIELYRDERARSRTLVNAAVFATERAEKAEALVAGLKSEWFRRGQESVRRKNESGCCCKIDDDDKILSACNAHADWVKQQLAEKDREIASLKSDARFQLTEKMLEAAARKQRELEAELTELKARVR